MSSPAGKAPAASVLFQRFRLVRGALAVIGFDQILRIVLGRRDRVALDLGAAGQLADDFAVRFAASGLRDAAGRSLRDHDLTTRLFRHPLSYMIHSDAFAALSPQAKSRIWQRLEERLAPTPQGRTALAIAADTGPGAPARWKTP